MVHWKRVVVIWRLGLFNLSFIPLLSTSLWSLPRADIYVHGQIYASGNDRDKQVPRRRLIAVLGDTDFQTFVIEDKKVYCGTENGSSGFKMIN